MKKDLTFLIVGIITFITIGGLITWSITWSMTNAQEEQKKAIIYSANLKNNSSQFSLPILDSRYDEQSGILTITVKSDSKDKLITLGKEIYPDYYQKTRKYKINIFCDTFGYYLKFKKDNYKEISF